MESYRLKRPRRPGDHGAKLPHVVPDGVISSRGCIDQQSEVRRRAENKRRDKNTKTTKMDSLEKDTRKKYKTAIGGVSCCCILLLLFIFSNPELNETRVLANDGTMQVSAVAVAHKHPTDKHPKETASGFETEGNDEDEVEEKLYESDMPPNSFDELMRRFDETPPNTDIKPKCLKEPKRTRPTIFFSLGRSGSNVILHRLIAMTNSHSNSVSVEYVGQNIDDNLYFFDTTIPVKEKFVERGINHIPMILNRNDFCIAKEKDVPGLNNSEHGQWFVNHLCRLQRNRPNSLVGMKWKPNFDVFMDRKEARETLQLMASLAAQAPKDQPPIVSIRSRRNMLDVRLSNIKHYQNQGLISRCVKDDKACLEQHKHKLVVPNVPKFYADVHSKWQQENIFDELLLTLKIPHVTVSYERLFYPDNIDEGEEDWNNMLQLISPGAPRESWDEIQNAMPYASTSLTRNHKELIENWEEVYDAFRGTEVEHLFRLSD